MFKSLQIVLLFIILSGLGSCGAENSAKATELLSAEEAQRYCSMQAEMIFHIAKSRDIKSRDAWLNDVENETEFSDNAKFNLKIYINTAYKFSQLSPQELGDLLYRTCFEKFGPKGQIVL